MPVVAPPPPGVRRGFTAAGLEHPLSAHKYCYISLAILAAFTALQLAIIYRLLQSWEPRRVGVNANSLQRSHTQIRTPPVHAVWTKPRAMESSLSKPTIITAADTSKESHADQNTTATGLSTGRSTSLPPLLPSSFLGTEYHGPAGASWQFSRHLPPPPPLTPPSLFTSAFPPKDGMGTSELEASSELPFIHQPNPDYTAELSPLLRVSPPAASYTSTNTRTGASLHRRNYTRFVPVRDSVLPSSMGSSQARTMPTELWASDDSRVTYVSPQGYDTLVASVEGETKREIGLRGEIISALDDAGAGWKRHTRVYGGGVCLACLAADNGGSSANVVSKDA